jgi:hypothetical protein
MGKHEVIEDKPEAVGEGHMLPVAASMGVVTPRMALASLDLPGRMTASASQGEATAQEGAQDDAMRIDAPPVGEMSEIEAAAAQPPDAEDVPTQSAAAAPAPGPSPRVNRFTLLAAALAVAAALGAMAGVLSAYLLLAPTSSPVPLDGKSGIEEIQALKENVVQARVELAALKVSLEAGNRSANAQLTRIGERIDRIDRSQAEPLTKLNKAIETLERIARGDVTGSTHTPGGSSPPAKANVLEGWLVREVHRGVALIEGRMGMVEIEAGDVVPGLGRVDSIRKQDGRWVVVTSKGTILSAR